MKTITITGNIGANAVVRTLADGKQIMTFNVAVNSSKDIPPIWFGCVSNFREKMLPYLIKGQAVCVIGELMPRVYNGNLDLGVSVDKMELVGSTPNDNSQENTPAT